MTRLGARGLGVLAGALGVAAALVTTAPPPSANAANETVTVDLSTTLGVPQYRASGTLYGMTENGTNPPDSFYRDIKWHFERAGGAQLDRPGGWVLVKNSAGQYLPRGEWWMYRFYGGMTGSLVATTPSADLELVAAKATGKAKVLLGNHGSTGTMTVAVNRLDTVPGLITGGEVRVIVQRVPDNGGGAVVGPVTITDQTVHINGNSVAVSVPWTNANDGYTITVQP